MQRQHLYSYEKLDGRKNIVRRRYFVAHAPVHTLHLVYTFNFQIICSLVMYRLVYPTLQFRMVNRDMDIFGLLFYLRSGNRVFGVYNLQNVFCKIFFRQNNYTLCFMSSTLKANHQYNLITNTLLTSSKYPDIQ